MKYSGDSFAYSPGTDRITDAIVVPGRIVIDWLDGEGRVGHLELSSTDEAYYQGKFGYRAASGITTTDEFRHVEFHRFNGSKGAIVLLGRYWNTKTSNEDAWMLKLSRKRMASD